MNLKYYIFPLNQVPSEFQEQYNATFDTFFTVWTDTYRGLFGDSYPFYSNDFTRQDYVQCLFNRDVCVALVCFRQVRIHNPVDRLDSWFQAWSDSDWNKLEQWVPDQFLVGSYFTVHPSYRKSISSSGLPVSVILGYLQALHCLEIGQNYTVGLMRTDRSMDKLGKLWGGIPISTVMQNNIPSEIILFERNRILQESKNYPQPIFELFNNRIDAFQTGEQHDIFRKAG